MIRKNFELQKEVMEITNEGSCLLGMRIESRFRNIVVETEDGNEYIAEVVDLEFPKLDVYDRNVSIQKYLIEKMKSLDLEFVKLEKTCFNGQIFYHVCFEEME